MSEDEACQVYGEETFDQVTDMLIPLPLVDLVHASLGIWAGGDSPLPLDSAQAWTAAVLRAAIRAKRMQPPEAQLR